MALEGRRDDRDQPSHEAAILALFSRDDASEAETLLATDCGANLPGMDDATPTQLERIRFAAIRLSAGDIDRLREAIRLAQIDWRDLLVAADFADDVHAHERWRPGE